MPWRRQQRSESSGLATIVQKAGIAVATAEMAFTGGYGMILNLSAVLTKGQIHRNDTLLFSESNSRFIVEVRPEHQKQFETISKDIPWGLLGKVTSEPILKINGLNKKTVYIQPQGSMASATEVVNS